MTKQTKYLQQDIASHEARILELQKPHQYRKGSRLWPTEKDKLQLIEMYRNLISSMKNSSTDTLSS